MHLDPRIDLPHAMGALSFEVPVELWCGQQRLCQKSYSTHCLNKHGTLNKQVHAQTPECRERQREL